MDVFWQQGYEATSTDDLVRAIGIGRQSMYDTFGDKHQLYLEALQLYEANTGAALFKRLYEAPSPFAAVCDYILSIADGTAADRARGCFFVNATTELAPLGPGRGGSHTDKQYQMRSGIRAYSAGSEGSW